MNLILEWNSIALEAIRSIGKLPFASPDRERGGPPQVARSLGIIYSSIYDAWVAYDNVAKTVPPRRRNRRSAKVFSIRPSMSSTSRHA